MTTALSLNQVNANVAKYVSPPKAGAVENETAAELPMLRTDIELFNAEFDSHGTPSWIIHDPIKGKFYRLGWLQFELLNRWSENSAAKITARVNDETTLTVVDSDVLALSSFLVENELTLVNNRDALQRLSQNDKRRQRKLLSKAFAFTMYYRVPLVNPDKFLTSLYSAIKPLLRFTKLFIAMMVFASLFALMGISSHWYEFKDTLMLTMNPAGYFGYLIALVGINVLHECGHGLLAKHYRCRVPVMGVALIFLLPVCYSDISDAWRLRNRRQRLLIDAGGILVEAALAVIAILLWLTLPDGIGRMLAFFIAVTSLATTLFVNLNPFMKFDGYFLLSDWAGTENLQTKSFANLKWELRKVLVGAKEPMPYPVTQKTLNFHRSYAVATFIYRIFLYLGIAYMVYTYWFKLMGLILVAAIVTTMVIKPVLKEITGYTEVVRKKGLNRQSFISLSLFSLLVVLFLVPLPRKVTAPALLTAQEASRVFSPASAELADSHAAIGQTVNKGDLLFTLRDPSLNFDESRLVEEIALLQRRLDTETDWSGSSSLQQVQQENITSKQAELIQIRNRKKDLELRSPVNGEVVMLPKGIKIGSTVAGNTILAEIATTRSTEIRAYVSARDIEHIDDSEAEFINANSTASIPASLLSISANAIADLEDQALAMSNGGPIPVFTDENSIVKPKNDLYLAVLGPLESPTVIQHEQSGVVMFPAKARSLANSTFNRIYGVILRESGF